MIHNRRADLRRQIKKKFKTSRVLKSLPFSEKRKRMKQMFNELWPLFQVN